MADSYASIEEYRTMTGDESSSVMRITMALASQSAKLRAIAHIDASRTLTDDQKTLCRELVVDAVRKQLVPPTLEGFSSPLGGVTQASFSAGGFQQSVSLSNPSGSAWFDKSTLRALMDSLGTRQRIGTVMPSIGR